MISPAPLAARLRARSRPTHYRGHRSKAGSSIEKLVAGRWIPVREREDLLAYPSDCMPRAALAILADFTGDDLGAVLLHRLFCRHYPVHAPNWRMRTGHIQAWFDRWYGKLGRPRLVPPKRALCAAVRIADPSTVRALLLGDEPAENAPKLNDYAGILPV